MSHHFQRIGLFCKHNSQEVQFVVEKVIQFLLKRGHEVHLEKQSAALHPKPIIPVVDCKALGTHSDLIIVVGGDGSLLKAARAVVDHKVPVLGINRGRIGFLADITPDHLEEQLNAILDGNYAMEERTLLQTTILRQQQSLSTHAALNDVVLYNSDVARMIEFQIYIDGQFVGHQRSDGLITATPTGSTAYSLSGGGPILYPKLGAISLVPMFPHTLSSRPIVIDDESVIRLLLPTPMPSHMTPKISCDGQIHVALLECDEILIQKHPNPLQLIHPKGYSYFAVLREKLGWNINVSSDRYPKKA